MLGDALKIKLGDEGASSNKAPAERWVKKTENVARIVELEMTKTCNIENHERLEITRRKIDK